MSQSSVDTRPPRHMPGEFLVRFRADSTAPLAGTTGKTEPPRPDDRNVEALLAHLRQRFGLRTVEPVFVADDPAAGQGSLQRMVGAAVRSLTRATRPGLAGYAVLKFPAHGREAAQIEQRLRQAEALDVVEPVAARWLAAPRRPSAIVNRQWSLRAIDFFGATPLPSARRVPVAVLDSGIDLGHPLLPASVVAQYDHDGLSADDLEGHGTHVAGTIAALVDDIVGCSGIADTPLLVWKVMEDKPYRGRRYVAFAPYLRALEAVLGSGAQVLNLSIGGTDSSPTEALLFRQLHAADVFVVAAMGNEFEDGDPTVYPAAYRGVHAVAATDELDAHAPFSSSGRHAFLSAPGVNVLSTLPLAHNDPPFGLNSGTSMAAPHVSAVAALLRAKHPGWTVDEVAAHLAATARPAQGQRPGRRSRLYGHGIVQVADALR